MLNVDGLLRCVTRCFHYGFGKGWVHVNRIQNLVVGDFKRTRNNDFRDEFRGIMADYMVAKKLTVLRTIDHLYETISVSSCRSLPRCRKGDFTNGISTYLCTFPLDYAVILFTLTSSHNGLGCRISSGRVTI